MSTHTQFQASAIADLRDRTEYEAWLLEAVYEITNRRMAVEDVDELVYPPNGGPPTQTIYGIGRVTIGDWRPGFLDAGAPLVFITGFKLLDMFLEWILVENGGRPTFRFDEKIAGLQKSIRFPPPIANLLWLQNRLVSLYSKLKGLRGTIIHDRHFQTSGGQLQVSESKRGNVGPAVPLSAEDIRTLAVIAVSILRYVEGTWTLDVFEEKRLRNQLDLVAHLHGEPLLGQLPPALVNVRVYVEEAPRISVDLDRVRSDIESKRSYNDVLFNLRLVTLDHANSGARAFLLPWAKIGNHSGCYATSLDELAAFECSLPDGIDVQQALISFRAR